jgi:hypothetical protein
MQTAVYGAPLARATTRRQGARRSLDPLVSRALALQRTAGNRATTRVLQRAIIAIDGKGESEKDPSGRATRACLYNLKHVKGEKDFGKGDARGKVLGPAELDKLTVPNDFLGSPNESLYVLAHGSRYGKSIAGMNPKAMAIWLLQQFQKVPFTGTVKLVSCHSAADRSHRKGHEAANVYNFDISFAQELALWLGRAAPSLPFKPRAIQGIAGIGWVEEFSGRITAIDKDAYDRAMKHMKTDSDVGAKAVGKSTNPFTDESHPLLRGLELRAWFGRPRETTVPMTTSTDQTPGGDPLQDAMALGKGFRGKRTFEVGTGLEL